MLKIVDYSNADTVFCPEHAPHDLIWTAKDQ